MTTPNKADPARIRTWTTGPDAFSSVFSGSHRGRNGIWALGGCPALCRFRGHEFGPTRPRTPSSVVISAGCLWTGLTTTRTDPRPQARQQRQEIRSRSATRFMGRVAPPVSGSYSGLAARCVLGEGSIGSAGFRSSWCSSCHLPPQGKCLGCNRDRVLSALTNPTALLLFRLPPSQQSLLTSRFRFPDPVSRTPGCLGWP